MYQRQMFEIEVRDSRSTIDCLKQANEKMDAWLQENTGMISLVTMTDNFVLKRCDRHTSFSDTLFIRTVYYKVL